MTYEELKKIFPDKGDVWTEGKYIFIKACVFGDNFYDYGEDETPIKFFKKYKHLKEEILDNPKIIVVRCENCCACAGW